MDINQVLPSSLNSILPTLPAYTHFAGHPVVTTYSFSRTRDQVFVPSTSTTTLPTPGFVSYTNTAAPVSIDNYQPTTTYNYPVITNPVTTYEYKPLETIYSLPTSTFPLPYQISSSPTREVLYSTTPISNVQTTTYQFNPIVPTTANFPSLVPQIPARRYSLVSQPQPSLYTEINNLPPRRAYSLGNAPISDRIAMASVNTPVVGYTNQPSTAPYRHSVHSVAPKRQDTTNRLNHNYNPPSAPYNSSVPLDAYVAQRRKSAPHIIYEIPATRTTMQAMKEVNEVLRQEAQREALDRWVRYREQDRAVKSNKKAYRRRVKSMDPAPRGRTNWL